MRLGTVLVAAGVVGGFVTAAADLPPAVLVATWTSAGAGMGLASSRLNVLVLGYSAPGTQGTNSSAMSISDAVGSATALAVSGVLFALVTGTAGAGGHGATGGDVAGTAGFVAAFALAAALAVGSALTAPRVGTPPSEAAQGGGVDGAGTLRSGADGSGARQPSAGSADATAAST